MSRRPLGADRTQWTGLEAFTEPLILIVGNNINNSNVSCTITINISTLDCSYRAADYPLSVSERTLNRG